MFYLNLFGVAKVPEEHPLWAVDQAVVAVLKLTDFALVKGAIPEVEALVALILDVAVRFLEQKLSIWEIVQSLTMELLCTVFIQALPLIYEGLAL